MAKNRFINTRFWNDGFISSLLPLDRYLFLYFLTNEHSNIAGIYEVPMRTILHETGMNQDQVVRALKRFDGKIHYIDGWVYIKNFQRHQNQRSPLVQKGIKAEMESVPESVIKKISAIDTLSHLDLDSDSDLDSDLTSERVRSKSKSTNPDIRPLGEFWLKACKAIQGIDVVVDWAKCNALLKKRLGHEGMTRDRLELLMIWFLSQKRKYQDTSGNWQEKFKNTPDLAVFLSSARFNEMLSDEKNALTFMKDNLSWADKVYQKCRTQMSEGMTSMADLISKLSVPA
jgi:hypothetical protein